jgi:hypothetical protein
MSNPCLGLETLANSCLGLAPNMATSPCRGLTPRMTVRPKQTTKKKQRTIVHFSCQERERKKTQTIDYQRQSNHDDLFTNVAPCERRHVYAFM